MNLKFTKTRNVKIPQRNYIADAGIDFYIPDDWNNKNEYILNPQERINIPSGIKMNIPNKYVLIAYNKSGIASKLGLDHLAEVIDSGYQGEIHLNVVNTGNEKIKLIPGMKLIQFILIPIELCQLYEVNEEELFEEKTLRGENGFGSTG